MSIAAMNWAWSQHTGTPTEKLILMALADCANDAGECWPSQGEVARKCGVTRQTIIKYLDILQKDGLVTVKIRHRETDGGRTSNLYVLALTPVNAFDTPCQDRLTAPVNNALHQEPPLEPIDSSLRSESITREGFDYFWLIYPHKVGKGAARKAFNSAIKKTDHQTLIRGVEGYRATKPPDRSWCNPATWLNQERWTDEPQLEAIHGKPTNNANQPGNVTTALNRYLSARAGGG